MELPVKMWPEQSLGGGNELEAGSGNQRWAVEPEWSELGKDWARWGWTGSEDQVREDLASHGQVAEKILLKKFTWKNSGSWIFS